MKSGEIIVKQESKEFYGNKNGDESGNGSPNQVIDTTVADEFSEIPSTFECQQCESRLQTLEEFIRHMRTVHLQQHPSNSPFDGKSLLQQNGADSPDTCAICGSRQANMPAHLMEHLMSCQTNWKCQKCPGGQRAICSLRELQDHLLFAHTQTIFRCSICLELFSERDVLLEHMVTHASREQKFKCVVCQVEMDEKFMFERHIQQMHLGISPLKRPAKEASIGGPMNKLNRKMDSDSATNDFTGLKQHQRNRQQPQSSLRGLKCTVCDSMFADELSLDQHRLAEHCKLHKGNSCGLCRSTLDSLEEFMEHSRLHSSPDELISCVICRQSVRGEPQLRMHGEYHLDMSERETISGEMTLELRKSVECPTCKMKVDVEDYAKHLLLHVVNELSNASVASPGEGIQGRQSPTSKCPECGRLFESTDNLNLHMLEHLSESILPKDEYEVSEETNEEACLDPIIKGIHRRRHRQVDKATKCRICDKSFASREQLAAHWHLHSAQYLEESKSCDDK